jgi:uncharacterized damage-inducible protein DinB
MMADVSDGGAVDGDKPDACCRWPGRTTSVRTAGCPTRKFLSKEQSRSSIRSQLRFVDAVLGIPKEVWRERPGTGAWSVAEYLCHVRDVYFTYTIRLHRVRTEDRPALEPMFNDLRARRFRYNESDVNAVLGELEANAAGFCEEIDRTGSEHWDRLVSRLPNEERTALWLVRQAMHEAQHHLDDIHKTGAGRDYAGLIVERSTPESILFRALFDGGE